MNKQFLTRLSRSEIARVREVLRTHQRSLDLRLLFRDVSLYDAVETGSRTYLGGYDSRVLPSVGLFYDHVLLEICPLCNCVAEPRLLEPFLERKLAIPVLRAPYEEYSAEFAEIVLQYPHLSSAEFSSFRNLCLQYEQGATSWVCDHCVGQFKRKCVSAAESFPNAKAKARLRKIVADVFSDLYPFGHHEALLVQELESTLTKGDLSATLQVLSLAGCVEWFRTAQAYSAVPQISLDKLEAVDRAIKKNPLLERRYDITEINQSVLQGLRLSYNPSIPLETYLDIVLSRRDKIRGLVSDIVEKSKPSSEAFYSNLQRETERVNEEVRSLRSSKRTRLLEFATSFLSDNRTVITGCLSGAAIGLKELGPIGCVAGSWLGSVGAEFLRKKARIKMPMQTNDIKRAMATAVEPVYEQLLSRYLSKNLGIVQVWQLQRRVRGK